MSLVVKQITDRREGIALHRRIVHAVYQQETHYVQSSPKQLENARTLENGKPISDKPSSDKEYQQSIFVAFRDGSPVSCVVASRSGLVEQGESLGTLGSFESFDDNEAVTSLLSQAAEWLLEQGAARVIGPMDDDTWHRYRFNVGPYDEPPFLMEPYNPEYYPQLWEAAGFVLFESYHSKRVEDVNLIVNKFKSINDRLIKRGYQLQAFERKQFDQGLDRLYQLSLKIFAGNKLYTDISRESFQDLYQPLKSVLDSRLAWFAQSPEGEDVGFIFAIQDYHAASVAMRGRSDLLAKLRFLFNKRHAKAVNLKSMGVVPGHRRSGIGVALVYEVYRQMLSMGYQRANLCLIHDDNPSSRLDGGYGTILRRYSLYQYAGI